MAYGIIMAATDGSEPASRAVELAARLAAAEGARLVLLYVIEDGPLGEDLRQLAETEHMGQEPRDMPELMIAGVPGWMDEALRDISRAESDVAMLERLGELVLERAAAAAREAGAGNIERRLERGAPVRTIVEAAAQATAGLLVMGSRGLSDLKGLVFGSVSHKVAHAAPCTCVTVT